jgi:hypothetical protein
MKTRFIAAVAALALTPAAFAEEAAASLAPATTTAADTAALEGKIDALAEQYAETKGDVARLKKLKFSGYVQGRYAWLEAAVYNNGAPARDNFYIRRARLKAVYTEDVGQMVFQIDAAPSATGLKEAYARVNLPAGASLDVGLQLMPFGYEVGVLSSSSQDLLERSFASTRWLKGEYDTGAALNLRFGPASFRGGVFNGNGVEGRAGSDNDQLKDFIGRLALDLGVVTGGVSGWYGKVKDYTAPDDKEYDRTRYGADVQVYLDLLPFGGTAVKAEYMMGTTAIGTGAGGGGDALGVKGYGWYATLVQNLGLANQVVVRYQQYTPDQDLDLAATGNDAKVKRADELAVAYHRFLGDLLKLSIAYAHPINGEKGATAPSDPKADQFVVQAQARF